MSCDQSCRRTVHRLTIPDVCEGASAARCVVGFVTPLHPIPSPPALASPRPRVHPWRTRQALLSPPAGLATVARYLRSWQVPCFLWAAQAPYTARVDGWTKSDPKHGVAIHRGTDEVPADGRYHVVVDGEITFSTRVEAAALIEFEECRGTTEDPRTRAASARAGSRGFARPSQ